MNKDILAVCMIGAGSSWGRGPTIDAAMNECERELRGCWGSIYNLDNADLIVSLYDVTGNDTVRLEYTGLVGDNEDKHPIKLIEHRNVVLTPKRRRA